MNGARLPVLETTDLKASWWPDEHVRVAALARGWYPTAFREFVLKVHQRCNLACDYCYVYTKADQSWRGRPVGMSSHVWRATVDRIAEHARRHELSAVRVVLHGGEPLLMGTDELARIADAVRTALPDGCLARVAIQTNAVLLDQRTLDRLRDHDIAVGVSVDGATADHDRHRHFASGRGSGAEVERALSLLSEPAYERVFAGILCTIDLRADPVPTYESLLRWRPQVVDFLLPHANWANPPPRPDRAAAATYADWLIAVFERWYASPRQETQVRLLAEIINLALGGASRSEQVGLSAVAVALIESDGDIELVDSLKSTYPGAAATGLNVLRDSFDTALTHPGVVARQIGIDGLSGTCLRCPVHRICGGGNYAHRYDSRTGFRNPSVYSGELRRLIEHIAGRVAVDVAALARD